MTQQLINVGTVAGDNTGDPGRTAFQKVNANFTEIYTSMLPAGASYADKFTATGGQTAFTLSGNPGSLNNLDVSLDGATLVPGVDYSWSSTTLTLTVGATAGQTLLARYSIYVGSAPVVTPGSVSTAQLADLSVTTAKLAANAVTTAKLGAASVTATELAASAVVDASLASSSQIYAVNQTYNRTTAEISAGVTPTNYGYPPGDVRRYGAVGDGVTDDTLAIQSALNCNAKVTAIYGATHLVSYQGTNTVLTVAQRYCLKLPSGVTFDLNTATLKAANASNASVLINKNAGTSQDSDLALTNGTIDCNRSNQTTPATGEIGGWWFYNTLRLRIESVKVNNARQYAGRILASDYPYIRNIFCNGSDGDGFSFGIDSNSQWVRYGDIDGVRSISCLGTFGGGLQGNPAIFTAQYSNIGKLYGESCAGGIKVQDSSSDLNISEINVIGPTNGTVNSGFKIQGNSGAGLYPTRIKVGRVNANSCYGNGLFLASVASVEIGEYCGKTNGQGASATGADQYGFSIESTNSTSRVMIGMIDEDTPKTRGGRFFGSGYFFVGKIYVTTPTGIGVSFSGTGEGYFDDIKVDDTGSGMTYAFQATSGKGRIARLSTNVAHSITQSRVTINSGLYDWTIENIRLGSTDVLEGVVQLTNAATSTTVTCGHIWTDYVGGASDYFEPVIQMVPMRSSTRTLGSMYAVPVTGSSGTGFAIKHSAAGASDYVFYKVLFWKVGSTSFA